MVAKPKVVCPSVQDLIDRALAEDIGSGDITTKAVVQADARALARIEQKQPGVVSGLSVAQAVFERVDPDAPLGGALRGGRVARGRAGGRDRGRGGVDPRRRAGGAQLPRPAVGSRDPDGDVRARGGGHRRPDPRHAQDDAGPAGAREGGRPRGRRDEPPQRPLRRDPRQGEPCRAGGRRRAGGRERAQRCARQGDGRGRMRDARRGRGSAGRGGAADPARQHGARRAARRRRARGRARRARGERRDHL